MAVYIEPVKSGPKKLDPLARFRGPQWRHGLWLVALLLCALAFVWEWIWLDNLPTALTELQYAGNQNTARQVMDAWAEVGVTPDRILYAVLLDIPGLLLTGAALAWAAKRAEPYFRDGAHEWKNYVIGGAVFAAGCGLIGDLTLCVFLSDPLKHPAALPWVFFWITLKTFLFSAAALYAASGFGQSWRAGGFRDATRACGFSLFAALVGPGLLAFGHQGTAIFDSVTSPILYRSALLATLFFSLMCWGAARYAVTYKEKEKAKIGGAGDRTPRAEKVSSFFRSLVVPTETTGRSDPGAGGRQAYDRKKYVHEAGREEEGAAAWKKGWAEGEDWIPRFCGLAPSLLIILLILLADPTELQSKGSAKGVAAVGALVALILWIHAFVRKGRAGRAGVKRLALFDFYFYRATVFLGAVFILSGCFGSRALTYLTLDLLGGTGPLAAWFFSFSLLVPGFTYLVTAGRRYGKPFLALVLAYGFLINAADLNDDHGVRYKELPYTPRADGSTAPPDLKALNRAFDDWLGSDQRVARWKERHAGQPYPVVFVAAAGGGIVAGGVLTATMAELSRNKNTPGTEDHLFAISGVSGGSLGAVTYASLRGINAKGAARYDFSADAKNVLTSDMLSPTVAALFGPEMVQRFLPFAVPNFRDRRDGYKNGFALDRGRDLELAFEQALDRQTPGVASARAESMLSAYPRPCEASHLPALFLNTTCVETGQRMVISTLHPDAVPDDLRRLDGVPAPGPDGDWPLPFETLYDVNPLVDLPLTTAACLSARFPVVSPPASLPQWRSQPVQGAAGDSLYPLTVKRRYVDGGYYENSGVETAMDVIDALQRQDGLRKRAARHLDWRPVLLSVHMNGTDSAGQFARDDLSGGAVDGLKGTALSPRRAAGFDEVLGPANAFFNGWGGPARPQLMRARRRLHAPNGKSDFIEMPFPHPVILSWYLSKAQYGTLQTQARVLLNGRQGRRLRDILATPPAEGPAARP